MRRPHRTRPGPEVTTPRVSTVELRVLDGPNLYYPRPAIKLTLEIPGWMRAVARRRCSLPGAPGDKLGGIESRSATSRTVASEARIQPGISSVSLIAGRG